MVSEIYVLFEVVSKEIRISRVFQQSIVVGGVTHESSS